ncbi:MULTISPECIES: DUF4920 domain-containing protein [Tenacibaculum]|uniref:DUF4920 domain-containing protein n=1 Tax=Tenacibaculum TaxID=104267 RepID=UPI00089A27C4|nr:MULTISPECIES: DUF4920 domain-containing protein [unclassified Tenacibaculum]RBW57207.1 DUF4920 domain-containing protein [Tenacibaculum sp. E3R01]SEE26814.1 protein of unknown function [Tenacibaculum sp. MAR_2010_89]
MKKLLTATLVVATLFLSCKTEKKETTTEKSSQKSEYVSFGEKISSDNTLSKTDVLAKFQNLKSGDTLNIKFASTINEVCKKKGCWMKLDLGNEKESMVRFKDYGFFMPLNSDKKEVIVNGKAFVTETSVKDLQHYAKDAGKSEEEIAKITDPKYTYAFEADGVLLKN